MQETYINKYPNDSDGEIDFQEILYVLLKGKWIIFSLTAFISITGVIYSLLLPNMYESKALLVPVNFSSSASGGLEGYSTLAGLAGITIPSGDDDGNSLKATMKIGSLSFFENNIMPNIYLPDLMAVKYWDSKTNSVIYDENIYNTNTNTWIRNYSYPQQQIPSSQESFEVFKSNHLSFSLDSKSGFSTLSIKHQSPFIAKQWAELIVNEVNSFYRQKDKLESEKSVSYLNQQISITSLSEIKQVLAQLLQEESKKLTLIEANQFYVFDYIDPPAVMEKKSEPNRALISVLAILLGGMLSASLVLIRYYVFSKQAS